MANRTTLVPDKNREFFQETTTANGNAPAERERIFALFRRWGFTESTLDPGLFRPAEVPISKTSPANSPKEARRYYSHHRRGVRALPEPNAAAGSPSAWKPEFRGYQEKILERLIRADLFEQVLQSRTGSKRFSLEGKSSLIPCWIHPHAAGDFGGIDSIVAIIHRGRLNVMTHIACKTPHEVVAGFEDVDPAACWVLNVNTTSGHGRVHDL